VKYLEDLKKVYPQEQWDYEVVPLGRLKGQVEAIWAGEAVVDLITGELHQWARVFAWRSACELWPEVSKNLIPRFYPIQFSTTEESQARRRVASALKNMKFTLQGENFLTRDA
jgi:hypothetical protein